MIQLWSAWLTARSSWCLAPSGRQVPGTGHGGPERSSPAGQVPVCRGARALCGVSVREDLGSGAFFVHPGTHNPPESPNTPS
jgi:hypothetical protein